MAAGEKHNPFLTSDEHGKPVEFRITTPENSRALFDWMQNEDSKEASRRMKIKRMYDGFLPYDPKRLAAHGFKDRANLNMNELYGVIEGRIAAIHGLAIDTIPLIELTSKAPTEDGPDMPKIIEVIETVFSEVLRSSDDFITTLAHMFREADLYGLGPVTWRSPDQFLPTAVHRAQMLFPPNSPANSSEVEMVSIRMDLQAHYLFGLFNNETASEKVGWDLSEVRKLLAYVFFHGHDNRSDSGKDGLGTMETAMNLWRQNRGFETDQFKNVSVVYDFVREVSDGKVSLSIRSDAPVRISEKFSDVETPEKFLFRKKGMYDSLDQCLVWLPSNQESTKARGIRGIASRLFPSIDYSNKMLCSIMDAARLQMTFPVRGRTNQRDLSITQVGPITLFDPNLEPFPMRNQAIDIQSIVGVRELVQNVSNNNVQGLRGPSAAPERVYAGADRKTQAEVQQEAAAAERAELVSFVMRVRTLDKVFAETWRRFTNMTRSYPKDKHVELFFERCEARGLPKEIIKEVLEKLAVVMNRSLVFGDAATLSGLLAEVLAQYGGNLDEEGRIKILRDMLRYRIGSKAADKYRPEVDRSQMPTDSASFAMTENFVMSSGGMAMVGQDQLHWSHIPVHAELIQQIVETFQAGETEDPQRDLNVLEMATNHVREHLEYGRLQTGMEARAREVEENLRSLSPIIKGMQMAAVTIERQREAEMQKQQDELEELQRQASEAEMAPKLAKVDRDAEVDMRRVELDHEIKLRELQLKADRTNYELRMQGRAAEQKRDLMTGESEHKQELAAQETVAKTARMLGGINQGSRITRGAGPQTNISGEVL